MKHPCRRAPCVQAARRFARPLQAPANTAPDSRKERRYWRSDRSLTRDECIRVGLSKIDMRFSYWLKECRENILHDLGVLAPASGRSQSTCRGSGATRRDRWIGPRRNAKVVQQS